MEQFIPLIIVMLIVLVIMFSAKKFMMKGKAYSDYISKYPQCNKGGKTSCYNCGSDNIFLRKIGETPTGIINSHVCKNCGTALFRSTTS